MAPNASSPRGSVPSPAGGYEILNRLLAECRQHGRSPTLERWIGNVVNRLAEFRQKTAANERMQRDTECVERAYLTALELMQLLRLQETQTAKPKPDAPA